MTETNDENNKYPKSINNMQCIGPCYEGDSSIIHPSTLDELKHNKNFCPVDVFVDIDKVTGEKTIIQADNCYIPTVTKNDTSKITDMLGQQLISPTFKFSTNYFLRIYYNIGSLEDGIEWLDKNKDSPYRTLERVFNQIMILYGDNLSVVDHKTLDFINKIMLFNLPKIFKAIVKYIEIKDNKITLILPNARKTSYMLDKTHINIITSYIKEKFLGKSDVSKFVSKFIRYNPNEINKKKLSKILVKYMIDYIIKRIKLTLENK
jgi:hypothetical protein